VVSVLRKVNSTKATLNMLQNVTHPMLCYYAVTKKVCAEPVGINYLSCVHNF